LLLCYPDAYFTHSPSPELTSAPTPCSGWRGQLRNSILIHADTAEGNCTSPVMKGAGRLLARIGPIRRRARFGLIDPLGRRQGESRCLDLGAGNGMTLRYLSLLGWQATGVEIDPVAAEQAHHVSGCDVRAGSLFDAGFRSGVFNMIHVSHVIEHLPDLKQTLGLCFDLLAPGGRLVVIYPNPNSLLVKRIDRFAVTWDPPRHLVIPPADSLRSLLGDIGFDRILFETSARFAVPYRAVSRRYRRGIVAKGFEARAQMSDHLFSLFETLCVMAGFAVGEEVIIVAHKR